MPLQPAKTICPTCNKHLPGGHLPPHMLTHTGEKPYRCSHAGCTQSFTQASTLNGHLRLHNNQRPYTCNTCQRTFRQHSHLRRHARSYTGEKPFGCDYAGCEKRATSKQGLKAHLKSHQRQQQLQQQQQPIKYGQQGEEPHLEHPSAIEQQPHHPFQPAMLHFPHPPLPASALPPLSPRPPLPAAPLLSEAEISVHVTTAQTARLAPMPG